MMVHGATLSVDGSPVVGDFSIDRDLIRVDSMWPEIDPRWRGRDSRGHLHRGDDLSYTTEWVETYTYWCHVCCDEHTERERRCKECGVEVIPGTRTPETKWIPGLVSWQVVLESFHGDEIEVVVNGQQGRARAAEHSIDIDGHERVVYVGISELEGDNE